MYDRHPNDLWTTIQYLNPLNRGQHGCHRPMGLGYHGNLRQRQLLKLLIDRADLVINDGGADPHRQSTRLGRCTS